MAPQSAASFGIKLPVPRPFLSQPDKLSGRNVAVRTYCPAGEAATALSHFVATDCVSDGLANRVQFLFFGRLENMTSAQPPVAPAGEFGWPIVDHRREPRADTHEVNELIAAYHGACELVTDLESRSPNRPNHQLSAEEKTLFTKAVRWPSRDAHQGGDRLRETSVRVDNAADTDR